MIAEIAVGEALLQGERPAPSKTSRLTTRETTTPLVASACLCWHVLSVPPTYSICICSFGGGRRAGTAGSAHADAGNPQVLPSAAFPFLLRAGLLLWEAAYPELTEDLSKPKIKESVLHGRWRVYSGEQKCAVISLA